MDKIMMHIVNNIFLPRQLPQEDQSQIADCAGAFVRLVADVLAKEMDVGIDALKEAARMMESWARIQQESVNWEAVYKSIKALLPGQTFGLYVRAQNAGVTISIPAAKSRSATLAVFRVAASSTEVMSAPGDLSGIFPGWAVTTSAERVQSTSFAKQVADLANSAFEETLPKSRKAGTDVPESRDVADASYVIKWLLPAVAGHSLITGEAGVVRMRKKIRDDVLWKNTRLPWRRSGEYMTVKVVLQSTLMGRLGAHDGLVAYKLIILRVMTLVLRENYPKMDTDVLLQILSKLARRLSKLKQLSTTSQTTPTMHVCVQDALKQSCQMLKAIRTAIIDERWQRIVERETFQSEVIVNANKLDFGKHTKHLLLTARPHLQLILSTSLQPALMKVNEPKCFSRNKFSSWPNMNLVINSSPVDDIGEWLYDFEIWVRDILWPGRQDDVDNLSAELFNLLIKYINLAKNYYKGDALGSSRMILTAVTIVAALDRLAGLECPMLRDYNHGVDTTFLRSLLLPYRDDMEHLVKLEAYFFSRVKDQMFQSISLISEDEPSPQAFSVRFAQRDPHIQKIKNEILEFDRQRELEKLKELFRERKRHDNFVRSAAAMSCNFNTDRYGFESHAYYRCEKCRLNREAAGMRVDIYERPLPEAAHLQDAVLYELMAPISSFIVLRDALHVLNRDVFGVKLDSKDQKQGMWLSHEPLLRWISAQSGRLTTLCSTSKLFAHSHYSSQHPSDANESFIKPNGFNVRLMECARNDKASVATYRSQGDVYSLTTLDADGVYKCLQWTIDGTSHTENQVLARQVKCPPELNLSEYKAFGTLRAGHLLQIRNITRVLEMQTLSLSKPSVVNLFARALWQTGPPIPGKDPGPEGWFRESHLDLREQSFARYVIKQLLFLIENNRENWKDHLALLSIVIIGARVLAMSEVAWEQAAGDVLCRCRAVAENWLDRIEQVLGKMMGSPIDEVQKMRSKLVDVAAIAALTFDVDVRHLKLAMRNKDDVVSWLRAVARIHDNTLLNFESSLGTFQRHLLRRVQNTALRLEETLNELIKTNNSLNDFIVKHWADGEQGQVECWTQYSSPCERWWKSGFKHFSSGRSVILQMDILRGSFLVDGCPVARLPATITGHQDYRRVFGSHVFQVQPAAASSGTFVSVHKLNNSVFTFALMGEDKRLVVKERRHDESELELFPSRFLSGDLPRLLVENYSHWILKTERGMKFKQKQIDSHETDELVLFRPVKFDDDKFADLEAVPFVLNIGSSCVHDTQRDRDLVDVCSPSFRELYDQVLCRLELSCFIHVFVGKLGAVSAELPRMGLSFDIDPISGILRSREQPGFFVPKNQSLGTLVGLRHGLLLQEQILFEHCTLKRCLIVPHSTNSLNISMENYGHFGSHPAVKVDLAEFSSPSIFVFDVDDRLQCLRGPATPKAWLYLALLHASTSHPLPDPFTGLTGTESAMRLLQSPRCWSCKPYEPEAISILLDIARLSPIRDWYPKHLHCMQTVTWPTALFTLTAVDAFHLVVEKLVKDSQRLRVLFPSSDKPPTLPHSTLGIKSYWRSREFFGQEAQMNSEFEKYIGGIPAPLSATMSISVEECDKLKNDDLYSTVRSLAELGHTWDNIGISQIHPLHSLLLNCPTLDGASDRDFSTNPTVGSWRQFAGNKFADCWLDLYNFARQASRQNCREEFTLLLSLLAFLGVEAQHLFLLQCVAVRAEDFKSMDPPVHESYICTHEADFDVNMVNSAIKRCSISFDDWRRENGGTPRTGESRESFSERELRKYDETQAADIENLSGHAWRYWFTYFSSSFSFPSSEAIDSHSATRDVWGLFTRWRRNKELHKFVSNVEEKILKLSCEATGTVKNATVEAPRINHLTIAVTKLEPFRCNMPAVRSISDTSKAESIFRSGQFWAVDSERIPRTQDHVPFDPPPPFLQADETSCEIAKKFHADLRKSWSQRHKVRAQPPRVVTQQQLAAKLRACKIESASRWRAICAAMKPGDDDWTSQALEAAGLWRRVLPVVLLPRLVSPGEACDNLERVRVVLGALAVIWTLEQQAERCLRLMMDSSTPHNDVALQRELANTGHLNWSPKDRPEWLILELEGDYLMRTIQVDVTNRMLHPDGNENAVLQLNMGEGKTSVIVPVLCASISDGQQFARLTVLSSLFRINFDALKFKLGGLLNRRVYTFPCRRDIKVNVHQVGIMKTVYQECIAKHGVVVTRPEHRLSAQLMVLELCRAHPNAGPAAELRDLQELVNSKARDVLDESDLILQVKYQVVYTIGEQMNMDGGALRWKVSQSVLRSAQQHCNDILNKFGADAIEFKAASEGPFVFPHVRLLSEAVNISLCEMIADDLLAGKDDSLPLRQLRGGDRCIIRNFILPAGTGINVSFESIYKILPDGEFLDTILILRGLLCYGVLMHALRLRWRVQFGVRASGQPKMAVPFRAKDVPVERAEYGHPDVAIMLTQLSYYNSGLSDAQMLDAFDRLNRLSTCEVEYRRWLIDVPAGCLPESLRTLSSINLDDFVQRTNVLFPILRRNMRVVDFWLSTAVFPIESKQFEGKLVASAWDLCGRTAEGRPVSGFSGTKDTTLLLPPSIIQRDLPELQGTDGVVIENLLRNENSSYHSFPSCINSSEILEIVVKSKALVLLDVGALMIELSNRDVATKWLGMLCDGSTIEAAIYFDGDNQIMAVDRDGRTAPLPLSPYQRQMDRCVVYLDDVHTRGTDLKIPYGSHACVTLGRGITKDCLVQACMRMRMLGAGHSVSFWASQEVHTSILSILPSPINRPLTSADVLHWVTRNSIEAIKDGFRHWGSQGIAHCRKQAVNYFHESIPGTISLQKLGDLNVEKEITKLLKCYGSERRVIPLPAIMASRLRNMATNMEAEIGVGLDAANIIMKLGRSVLERIEQYAGGIKCFAQVLDEEQERELEHEIEEEEEIQRPGEATPRKPVLSPHVRRLATDGCFDPSSTAFLPLLEALHECASLWQRAEPNAWSDKLFITREFGTVLSPESVSRGVDFLRPVAWLAIVPYKKTQAIVLLSPVEVNSLLPEFRRGRGAHLHMVAPRRRAGQDFMLCERALMLPVVDSSQATFDDLPLIAQLLAFSGSAFFANNREQSAYCDFLGLCPRPRSMTEADAFDRGDIKLDGFILPEKRQAVKSACKTLCGFQESPVPFMADLLSVRGWLGRPSASHVGQILFIGQCDGNVSSG
ncbi:hypothetical protein O6H91_19G071900 [Diphasiastrum complanatum]|uniref:Uncharacterized protein n=1 Tax=Diphasiastrum complanatum TaxID=34168 RepID=A0ACC2AWG4_DIPCM|nr:hypothetical protein O6H91_19G071900 [Diphasiastrum complanatum]